MVYAGPSLLTVPVVRTLYNLSEPIAIEVASHTDEGRDPILTPIFQAYLLTSEPELPSLTLYYRPLGSSQSFSAIDFELVTAGRAVFSTTLAPQVCLLSSNLHCNPHIALAD